MKTREFQKNDWDTFAGSEGWGHLPNVKQPLIGEGVSEGRGFAVVFDRSGVFASDGETDMFLRIPFVTQAAAAVFAAGFPEAFVVADLERLGFLPI